MRSSFLPSTLRLGSFQELGDEAVVTALESRNSLIGMRKHRGVTVIAEIDAIGAVRLYASAGHSIDHRFKHIEEEIWGNKLPPRTVLIGDLALGADLPDDDSAEDPGRLAKFLIAHNQEARAMLRAGGRLPKYVVWGMLFLGGESLAQVPYDEVLGQVREKIRSRRYIRPMRTEYRSFASMKELAERHDWAGLMLFDGARPLSWTVDGTSPAFSGHYLWNRLTR